MPCFGRRDRPAPRQPVDVLAGLGRGTVDGGTVAVTSSIPVPLPVQVTRRVANGLREVTLGFRLAAELHRTLTRTAVHTPLVRMPDASAGSPKATYEQCADLRVPSGVSVRR